jgi:hypothetical protein
MTRLILLSALALTPVAVANVTPGLPGNAWAADTKPEDDLPERRT